MGRLFLLEFDQSNPEYYVCKCCQTHIALKENIRCFFLEDGGYAGVFYNAVNVQVDKPIHHRQLGAYTVADIYCVKCGDKLGWKYIQIDPIQVSFENENVKLTMGKLTKIQNDLEQDEDIEVDVERGEYIEVVLVSEEDEDIEVDVEQDDDEDEEDDDDEDEEDDEDIKFAPVIPNPHL